MNKIIKLSSNLQTTVSKLHAGEVKSRQNGVRRFKCLAKMYRL